MRAVTGKVALGQADAGFVYVTDARSVADQVSVIRIPAWAQPRVRYEIAVVSNPPKSGGTRMDQDAPLGEGPGGAQELGFLPLPAAAVAIGSSGRRSSWRRAPLSLFLLLPIAAVFLRVPPRRPRLGARNDRRARRAARDGRDDHHLDGSHPRASARRPRTGSRRAAGRFATSLVTLVELPLVLPPAVAGIGLLVAFGRAGLLGGTIDALGIDIAFTKVAVILAVTFVASPFFLRTAIAAFEAVDPTLPAAARTLGARPRSRLLPRDAPARARRPRRGRRARVRPRARRVRRDDHVRGLAAGRHADALARDLRAIRRRLRRRARDQRAADHRSARSSSCPSSSLTRWRSGSGSLIPFAASSRPPT